MATGSSSLPRESGAWGPKPKSIIASVADHRPASDADLLLTVFGSDLATVTAGEASRLLAQTIAAIDTAINKQLDAIYRAERLKELEGRWRGLKWLVRTAQRGRRSDRPILRILNVSWPAVARDIDDHDDLAQSTLFRLLYDGEFGQAGGQPFGLMVCDHHFSHKMDGATDDIATLRGLAEIGYTAFCPFVVGTSADVFGVDHIGELDRRSDIASGFTGPDFARLKGLQREPMARFLAFSVGAVMVREGFPREALRQSGTGYRQQQDPQQIVWAPSSFALAHTTIRAIINYNWPAAIHGAVYQRYGVPANVEPEGGVLSDLDTNGFHGGGAGDWVKMPLEVYLSRDQETQLNELGFMVPRVCPYTTYAAIHNCPVAFRPEQRTGLQSAAAFLPNVMSVGRFAHAIKILGRSWVGSLEDAKVLQRQLQSWLNNYRRSTMPDDKDNDVRPLRDFQVRVEPVTGRPGAYSCNVKIQPHFQIDYIVSEFQIDTEIKTAA